MALEATHIRFALALKDDYKVSNEGEYILGTSYPDSRFTTGISRDLTHGMNILDGNFASTDFKKGWQAHEICDHIQHEAFRNFVPFLDEYKEDWNDEKWVDFTAVKIIQDILDRQSFNINKYLPYLENAKNPNGEDIEKIKIFNRLTYELYRTGIKMFDYRRILIEIGVRKDRVIMSTQKVEELIKDKKLINDIKKVFPYMVEQAKRLDIY